MIPIRLKLQGKMGDERSSAALAPPMSVVNQVEVLIKEAVSPINLVSAFCSLDTPYCFDWG
jgi:hypothetical protein